MWSISPKLWRQRTRLQEKHHGEKVKGRQHLLPSRTVSYTGIFDQCLLRVLFVGPQFDKSFEEQCLCQFGGLNKSCSVETLENDNYSRQSVFDTLCHRNYHNKSWFSKGRETNRQSRFDAWYRMLRAGAYMLFSVHTLNVILSLFKANIELQLHINIIIQRHKISIRFKICHLLNFIFYIIINYNVFLLYL